VFVERLAETLILRDLGALSLWKSKRHKADGGSKALRGCGSPSLLAGDITRSEEDGQMAPNPAPDMAFGLSLF
jgi:hypothetical protein